MTIDHQFGNTKEILYSQSLDILLQWGFSHLFQPDDDLLLQELEGRWEYLRALNMPMDSGLDILEKEVHAAISLLHSSATLSFDQADIGQVVQALKILDQVVFLAEALESFPGADIIPKKFFKRADNLLYLVTVEKMPPPLRLIPLNPWRKNALKFIPSHARYLFPWYAVWSDLPSDFLFKVIENRDKIADGTESLGLDKSIFENFITDLKKDAPLMKRIYHGISPETAKTTGRLYAKFMKKIRQKPLTDYSIKNKKIQKPGYGRVSPKNLTFLISVFIAAILTIFIYRTMPYLLENGVREKNNEIVSKKIGPHDKNNIEFPADMGKIFPGDGLKYAPFDQLKLIGIIRLKNERMAFIRDFDGNIYLVKKGAVMGQDLYVVSRIFKDKIIIEKKDDPSKIVELVMD